MVAPFKARTAQGVDYDGFFRANRKSPYPLVKGIYKLKPTDQQRQALDFLELEHHYPPHLRKRRLATRSGKGTGKTTLEAILAQWRPLQARDGQSIVTAPTGRQCRDVFLGESRRLLPNAPKWFREFVDIKHDRIDFAGRKTWGVLTATAASDIDMQGFHNRLLTFMLEECSGLSSTMIEQAKGTLTNEDSYLMAWGNPNKRSCEFYQMFFGPESDEWQKLHWDSRESPITDKSNIERLIREYGIHSDMVRVAVLGQFPTANPDAIMDPEAILRAMGMDQAQMRNLTLPQYEDRYQIGIDMARFGGDESVIACRHGGAIVHIEAHFQVEPQEVLERAMELQQNELQWPTDQVLFVADAGGLGSGAMRTLYSGGKRVFEFNNGGASTRKDFKNKITEAWFVLRNLLRDDQLALPHDRILHDQLESRTYKLADDEVKMRVLTKKEHCALGYSSPDRGEAVAYACYDRAKISAKTSKTKRPRRQRSSRIVGQSILRRVS